MVSVSSDFCLLLIVDCLCCDEVCLVYHEVNAAPFSFTEFFFISLSFQVMMVRITERVVNTYFAKLYLSKVIKRLMIFF